ncbi:MAG: LptF/LptG family permease [Candidatus Omnitrophica bacterium]|nr:LptF/LptG family permease [Candidatus Omnitrophota bacterium]
MDFDYKKHTVDFYILRAFWAAFAFIFSLFIAIVFVVVTFEELDAFGEERVTFGLGLTYVFLRMPHELVKATPMIVVLSMVIALGNLIRHKEMLMLYIAGYTPIRLCAPLVMFLIVLLAGLFWINENLCGPFSARAQFLMETRIKENRDGLTGEAGVWIYGEGNRIFRAQTFYPISNRIDGLSVFVYQGQNQRLSEWIEADSAVWNPQNGKWILNDVTTHKLQDNGSFITRKNESLDYDLDRSPEDFGAVTQDIEQMSHGDLKKLVDSIREAGENPWMYLPDLRIKEAFPFAVFFLGMLTYAMMLFFSSGGKASGLGLGLVAVILYFMALSLGKSFARANAIPPWAGAWTPNIICFLLTAYFFNRLRQDI